MLEKNKCDKFEDEIVIVKPVKIQTETKILFPVCAFYGRRDAHESFVSVVRMFEGNVRVQLAIRFFSLHFLYLLEVHRKRIAQSPLRLDRWQLESL